MLDGPYTRIIEETTSYRIILLSIYKSGVIIFENLIYVDLKSNLSEEFKEKLKEYQ